MKPAILLIFLMIVTNLCFSQFGIITGYRWNDAPKWKYTTVDGGKKTFLASSPSVGIDYQFRLKNKRIEFLPELSMTFKQKVTALDGRFFQSQFISLFVNTNIYLLDFKNDCNCPAYYNENKFLNKGLFLQTSLGVSSFETATNYRNGSISGPTTAFSFGGGIGFDIGILSFINITPMINIRYFTEMPWIGLGNISLRDKYNLESDAIQFFAGLRLGFRFDWI